MLVAACSPEKSHKNLGAQLCRETPNQLTSSLLEKFATLSPEWQPWKNRRHKKEVSQSSKNSSYYFEIILQDRHSHLEFLCNFNQTT